MCLSWKFTLLSLSYSLCTTILQREKVKNGIKYVCLSNLITFREPTCEYMCYVQYIINIQQMFVNKCVMFIMS